VRISLLRSTSFGLMIFASVAFMIVGGAVISFVYWSMLSIIDSEIDGALAREYADMTAAYRRDGYIGLLQTVARRASLNSGASRIYLLQRGDGNLTGNLKDWPADAPDPGKSADVEIAQAVTRARVHTLTFDEGVRLLVGRSLSERDDFLRIIEKSFLYVIWGDLFLGVAAGTLLARYARRRLDQINAIAGQVREGNLAARATVGDAGDEYDLLAQNFNTMLDRIQRLMATIRGVTENIAHDLRTPLNRMRGRLEVALMSSRTPEEYQAVLNRAIAETETIVGTFNGILKIARLTSGALALPMGPVDLGEVVEELVDLYRAFSEESGVVLMVEPPAVSACGEPRAFVRGDAHLISQAAGNLIDNAIKYCPPQGKVVIAVAQTPEGVALTIADNGPGIPEGKQAAILERFVRLESTAGKPGFGLGLGFVLAVAEWHEAQLTLSSNSPGLRATLFFPAHGESAK
jgi:signal transduction histidine kinase